MPRTALVALIALAILALLLLEPALAQITPTRRPFGLPGGEGPGGAPSSGIAAWLLARQAEFSRAMSAALRDLKTDGSAFFTLAGLGLAYGVFHAAGPGHGKAVIASYVVADGRSLKRGFAIALAAGAVFAAGSRPCTGAILVLVFALAQGLFAAGIAAVAAISLGTAITTGAIAVIAVYFKRFAVRIAAGRGKGGEIIVRLIEFLAALAVLALGTLLLVGYAGGGGG